MRIISDFRSKQKIKFLNKREALIFSYLEGTILPAGVVNKIPRRKYKFLLEYVGELLLTLKGEDFDNLKALITSTKLSDYLLEKLNSNSKKNIVFASFFAGIANIEKAIPVLQTKIKRHNEQIFLSCSTALAKINSYDSLQLILTEFKRYRHYGYLLLILTEFDEKICDNIIELLKSELPEPLIVTFVRVLRYYKYQAGGQAVLTVLVYSYSKEILIESLKFIEEINYKNAIPAVSKLLEHSKPEIRSQAIKTIMKLDGKAYEDRIYSKLFDNNYEVKYQAAFAILNYCDDGEKKLSELAYDVQKSNAAAVCRMLISEKKVKEG
jgi:uncharacterized protein YpiB (UPF0302 family)